MRVDAVFLIPHDHPSLAGHFPGDPVAPGALVLDKVMTLIAQHAGLKVVEMAAVKFLQELRSGLPCHMAAEEVMPGSLRVVCVAGGKTVLTASLICKPLPVAEADKLSINIGEGVSLGGLK